jgi:hypothetical protein
MRIVFTHDTTEDELFTSMGGSPIIPRVDEKVVIDGAMYEVAQVIHWFDLKEPSEHIEITLFPI